jgi:hypothetical protein
MPVKQPARRRHIPQRTCVGCRTVLAKRELIRVVRTPDGVFVDPTGRSAGRGAYVHNQRSCWEKALKGALAGALKVNLAPEDRARLQERLDALPKD